MIGLYAFAQLGVSWYRRAHPPAAIVVPELRGRSLDEARKALMGDGFRSITVCGDAGSVRATDPAAGKRIAVATAIEIDLTGCAKKA